MAEQTPAAQNKEREEFYARIDPQHLTPLWSVMSGLITPEPKSQCQAHLWRYEDVRPALMEAGDLITAKEAERRVLILENPGLRGQSKITTSLYAGLQLVMPARSHRLTGTPKRRCGLCLRAKVRIRQWTVSAPSCSPAIL